MELDQINQINHDGLIHLHTILLIMILFSLEKYLDNINLIIFNINNNLWKEKDCQVK